MYNINIILNMTFLGENVMGYRFSRNQNMVLGDMETLAYCFMDVSLFLVWFDLFAFNINFNTLKRYYHDGYSEGQRKPVHTSCVCL